MAQDKAIPLPKRMVLAALSGMGAATCWYATIIILTRSFRTSGPINRAHIIPMIVPVADGSNTSDFDGFLLMIH